MWKIVLNDAESYIIYHSIQKNSKYHFLYYDILCLELFFPRIRVKLIWTNFCVGVHLRVEPEAGPAGLGQRRFHRQNMEYDTGTGVYIVRNLTQIHEYI